jgi:CHAT domain-containing protein/tetratricopeptide (TPR) repeat protein
MTNNAGVECIERFKQTGEIKDLEEAILQLNEVLDHTPSSSAERPVCLCNLSSAFTSRFARFGEVKDVDSAIERLREAVSLTPLNSVDRPDRLTNLGISYQDRFKRRAEVKDIDSAIELQCEAVNLTPLDSADRPGRLTNLGNAFVCRFERVGEVKDIDSAIERHNEAVRLTALDNEKRPVFLNNLGISFQSRFERFGEVKDIDSAIQRQSEAVSLSPLDSAVRPGHISNLGSAFCCRFNLLEEVKDIDSAIERHSEAVSLTPLDSADRPACLNNLGISFQTRFERFVEVKDIDSAIERHREAVNLTPADNAERLGRLSNLGNSFLDRFELLGEVKDIDSAFEHLHEALSLTPPDSADRPGRLSNLGICLQHRFERFGEIKDINSAIEWKSEAVDLTPLDAADRPRCLHSLADSLLHRFRRLGDVKDFSQGVHALRTSSLSPNGKPISRIRSALLWAHLMHTYDLTMAIEAYDQAIGLLPQVVWVGLSAVTQLERLTSKIQSLACDAAACMISLAQSKPDHEQYYLGRAVELLDQGRSVLWSQASSLKQDLKTLHKVNSQLAEDLDRIGKALGQSCFRNSKDMLSETDAQLFRRYAENWDELVCRVRKLPGFDHFLLPSPISKLRHAADGGPVVIVNSCEFRCDALIVSRHGNLVLVPFSKEKKATIEGLISQQQLFASARSTRLSRPKQESLGRRVEPLQVLLYQTWSLLGEPIVRQLKNLGVIGSEPLSTCRVWWCLTGSLTFLPIHASLPRPRGAGGNTLGMMDIVVSSYTPTLSALLRSRRHTMPSSFHMLAVGQPNSRDHPPLYCVEAEMKAICDLLSPDRVTFLKGPDASVNAVAAAMPNCTWAHFACHGIQDQKQPMDSGLLMDNNHLLTLSHIAQSSLESAEFAFLSSCESATGSKELSNESVHLTAGLQFVGFRAVIGTMWTVADKDALIIAEQVYRELFKDGATRANVSNAAFALNRAVRYLRDEQKVPFAQWVPFVHFGS